MPSTISSSDTMNNNNNNNNRKNNNNKIDEYEVINNNSKNKQLNNNSNNKLIDEQEQIQIISNFLQNAKLQYIIYLILINLFILISILLYILLFIYNYYLIISLIGLITLFIRNIYFRYFYFYRNIKNELNNIIINLNKLNNNFIYYYITIFILIICILFHFITIIRMIDTNEWITILLFPLLVIASEYSNYLLIKNFKDIFELNTKRYHYKEL
ncbi:hypothetical protein ABK040_010744 [Willaertia magna]